MLKIFQEIPLGRGAPFCGAAIDPWELSISNPKNGEKLPEKLWKNQEKIKEVGCT